MEILNMTSIEAFFKFFAMVQILLFIALFVLTLSYKIWKDYQTKQQKKWIKRINKLLVRFDKISSNELIFLKNRRVLVFTVFSMLEKERAFPDNAVIPDILKILFLPYLSEDVASTHWSSRNRAAILLQFKNKYIEPISFLEKRELLDLLHDAEPLVALNAAVTIFQSPTQDLIDMIIDIFSQSRRSQYELLNMMTSHAALEVVDFIQHRLTQEKDSYKRVFCYRLLRQLPKVEMVMPFVELDLNSHHIDLSLAAISYISYIELKDFKQLLIHGLNSPYWEVRARCAKVVGYTKDKKLIPYLEPLLRDDVWWVRFRAAESLSFMGKTGMDVLRAQNININKFAFEIAQQQIESYQLKKTIL
jgi:hypothetical protein